VIIRFTDDGRDRLAGWFTISTYPFGGGVLAIVRNITQRKRIEQAWQETDTRLRAIWENPTVLVAFKDRNLRYVAANPAAIRLLSQDPTQSIIGKTDAEIFPGPAAALLDSHDRDVLSKGQPTEVELAVTAPKASAPVWLHITKQPWRSQSGEIIGVVDIAFDITSRVRAQQELNRRREALQKLLAEETQLLQKAQDELARWTKQ
ncbi:MAG: PAS domain-containing protein, partial [candidate division WOR-3 bacterium]